MGNFSDSYDCEEVHDTRVEGLSYTGGPTASVTLRCAWADRFNLRTDLINNGYWPVAGAGGLAPRCQSVNVRPEPSEYDEVGQEIGYKNALLDVQYSFDESAGSGGGGGGGTGRQLYTESFEPQMELVTPANKKYWYNQNEENNPGPGNKKDREFLEGDTPPNIRQYTFTINRTFYNWVSVPITFLTLLNHINDEEVTFPSLGLTFAKETLLFVPVNSQKSVSSEGTDGYTVSVKFVYRPQSWNMFLGVDLLGQHMYFPLYTKVRDPQTGINSNKRYLPFQTGDFTDWIF